MSIQVHAAAAELISELTRAFQIWDVIELHSSVVNETLQ